MNENEKFFDIVTGGGFDILETEQSAESIEREFIYREVMDEIRGRQIASIIAYTDEDTAARYEMYRADLQEALYFQYKHDITKGAHGPKASDEELDAMAEEASRIEVGKRLDFQNRIAQSIVEVIYQMRHATTTSDLTYIKNLNIALIFTEVDLQSDEPHVGPFVELYDDMVPGDLYDLNSSEFLKCLLLAQEIKASQGELDTIEDTES